MHYVRDVLGFCKTNKNGVAYLNDGHLSFNLVFMVSFLHMSYMCSIRALHTSYTWPQHVRYMSCTCHSDVIHMYGTFPKKNTTHDPHMSYKCLWVPCVSCACPTWWRPAHLVTTPSQCAGHPPAVLLEQFSFIPDLPVCQPPTLLPASILSAAHRPCALGGLPIWGPGGG